MRAVLAEDDKALELNSWDDAMKEFSRYDLPTNDSFEQLRSQLHDLLVQKIRDMILELPAPHQAALFRALEGAGVRK